MNDMRTDLDYLLRQLRSATEPQVAGPTLPDSASPAPVPPVPMAPAAFLEAVVRVQREREASDALRKTARADLQAINATLSKHWAELDADPETPTIRAAE